ncbi:hypothetical protein LTR70_003489 [Exophiala xenobiotica]|uniref:CN hydrolase domain-containing protein n=1 Tax=Lithohypha guttulata TaxID=1690604 RepID=A0ABR0KG56_9EURO|nr:hypothetical protein LTR24_003037 [Lithohypha guttulata]KAK5323027.1 hypothetical protein LTR70_003489 [Exophiala xenobiotica]
MGTVAAGREAPARLLKVAAAQVGAVHRWTDRADTLRRLISLLEDAAGRGAQLVLFPELTLTTFFPRYLIADEKELASFFEYGEDVTRSANAGKLFQRADELRIDICVGYAERTPDGHSYNTCVYFSANEHTVIMKYRKSHLPGTKEPYKEPGAINQLEKRYFEEGQEGFSAFRVPGMLNGTMKKSSNSDGDISAVGKGDPIVGILICNDRRWSEAWRVYGLQGAELILCGYNTTAWAPHLHGKHNQSREQSKADAYFYHKLVMQSNSYTNSCFSVCAARCGLDDNEFPLIGGSCIVGPNGRIIAEAQTEEDEVIFAEIDLTGCRPGKETTFNFGKHRRTELYRMLVDEKGVVEPDLLSD